MFGRKVNKKAWWQILLEREYLKGQVGDGNI